MTDASHRGFADALTGDAISPRQFAALAALIRSHSGIAIKPGKQTMLEGRLRRRAAATCSGSTAAYCDRVVAGMLGAGELEQLINAVTTNKTDFFREPGHFDYLTATILPALQEAGQRRITAWSAACSTGAEPYTIAMLLDDFVSRWRGIDYKVVATDIDTEVVATAIKGIYPTIQLDPVPADLFRRYVREPRDPARGEVRIAPELRRKITFGRLNLMDFTNPLGEPFDLVFCRNVLIYFDRPTQEAVVRRLRDCLAPGGHLFLGHSESMSGFDIDLEQVGSTIFRRPE